MDLCSVFLPDRPVLTKLFVVWRYCVARYALLRAFFLAVALT